MEEGYNFREMIIIVLVALTIMSLMFTCDGSRAFF